MIDCATGTVQLAGAALVELPAAIAAAEPAIAVRSGRSLTTADRHAGHCIRFIPLSGAAEQRLMPEGGKQ
jgi:hypothetical protein